MLYNFMYTKLRADKNKQHYLGMDEEVEKLYNLMSMKRI